MNKIFLSLLVAVCVLGMVLIMLNERLRKPDSTPAPPNLTEPATQADMTPLPSSPADRPTYPPIAKPEPPSAVQTPAARLEATEQRQERAAQAPRQERTPAQQKPEKAAETAHAPQPSASLKAEKPHATPATPPKQESAVKPVVKPEAPKQDPTPSVKPETAKPLVKEEAPRQSPAEKEKEKADIPQQRSISKFVVFARDKGATVRLVATAPITYKSMALADPPRLVVDLEGVWQIKAPGVPKNVMVTNVRLGKESKRTRIVIDLKEKGRTRYILSKDLKTLDIRLDQ